MKYSEFIQAYNNKATDYDGAYGVQCVDLIKCYLDKVFGIKPGAWGNAKDYYEKFSSHSQLTKHFNKIANTATFVPQKGDIVIWGANVSKNSNCGHIAIATGEGNTHQFYSYDQNWGKKECHKVLHNYTAFLGVLRPKDQSKIK